MPDAAGIDLSFAFGLPPKEAIQYFENKGLKITWDWHEMADAAHAKAFTVAKAMKVEILTEIRSELQRSLKNGTTLEAFKANLTPFLQAKGWWGKDENGNQLGSEWRLENIFRTNIQDAYSAGRYQQQAESVDDFPYWQYVAVMDSRTRPSHAALNGLIFKFNDPFWDTHYPPNGFMCRCRVRTFSEGQFKKRGLELSYGDGNMVWENKKINKAGLERPVAGYRNPKTGKTVFTDPGWSSNPGKTTYNPDWGKILEDLKPLPMAPKQWEYVPGTQGGSNPGGVFMSPSGEKYYGKVYANPEQAKCEHLAYQIMNKLGIGGAETSLEEMSWQGEKRLVILSKWKEDAIPLNRLMNETLSKPEKTQLVKHYLNAALTNNWDFVGLNFENLAKTGNTWTELDAGGSFNFRAQGGFKAFTGSAESFETMLAPGMNPGKVYNGFLKQTLEEDGKKYIKWLSGLTDKSIKKMVQDAGVEHDFIAALKSRRTDLISRIETLMTARAAPGAVTAADEALVEKYIGKEFDRFLKGYDEAMALTKYEYAAIRAYSAENRYYPELNGTLLKNAGEKYIHSFSAIPEDLLNSVVKVINSGLDNLPKPTVDTVWRGAQLDQDFVKNKFVPGQVIELHGFQSTSTRQGAYTNRNTVFEIRLTSKQGGMIQTISIYPSENEFLMKSGLQYKVVSFEQEGGKTKILLEEIRQH